MKLKTETIYIHYDYPIVFSATSEKGNIFICLFADETDSHLRYLCREVSSSLLIDLENNKKDIRSIFESPGKLYSLSLNAQSDELISAIETDENTNPYLPEKDLFIGGKKSKTPQTSDVSSYSYVSA